jgi:hypothetical protein
MRHPQMQRGMVKIGGGEAPRNRGRIAFINPEPQRESKKKTRDEKPHKDRESETILVRVRHSAHSNLFPNLVDIIVPETASDARRFERPRTTRQGPFRWLNSRASEGRSPRPTTPDAPRRQFDARPPRPADRQTGQSKLLLSPTFRPPWPQGFETSF